MSYIEDIGLKRGTNQAFSDFLTIVVCALSLQEQEELYLKTIKPYTPDEINIFCSAFAQLVIEMNNRGEGLKDCLGDYYMDCLASTRKGQFFTPPELCDLMSQLIKPEPNKPVNDPACGSGRFFLSIAKIDRSLKFYGADIDYQCCQMTLINLCLNGLKGEVSHMDTLKLEEWNRWSVRIHPIYRVPYIHQIDLNGREKTVSEMIIEHYEDKKKQIIQEVRTVKEPISKHHEFLSSIDMLL